MTDNTIPEPTPAIPPEQAPPDVIGPALAVETTTNYKLLFAIIGAAVAFVFLTLTIVAFLASDPARTANIRDMFIIALAVVNIVIGGLLVVLIWQLQSLIFLLRNEVKPMLINANQTMNTIRGTTVFMSDNVAKPMVKVASFFSGLKSAASAAGGGMTRSSKKAGSQPSNSNNQPNKPAGS